MSYKGLVTEQASVGESWELSGVRGSESVVSNGALVGSTIGELLATQGAELLGVRNYARFGNEFPLLIKFIDAREDLSIQVHPDDALAAIRHQSKGKTEMWYVVDAMPEARLRSGFAQRVTPQEYVERVANDTVTDILKEYQVSKGDLFFLPAGRIHSIGAGCFIAEIQQASDITYRIYDFNRMDALGNTRELHTAQAVDAIDYTLLDDYRTPYDATTRNERVDMVACPYFTTALYVLDTTHYIDLSGLDSFVIYICVEGEATIDCDGYSTSIKQGETLLVPAASRQLRVVPSYTCRLLSTHIDG